MNVQAYGKIDHEAAHLGMRPSPDVRLLTFVEDLDNSFIQDPEAVAGLQRKGEQQDLGAVRSLVDSCWEP